jgi:2'-5' RNA ligase
MFAVWFLFGKEDTRYLEHIIKDLAAQYDSPFFMPHMTVYGLVDSNLETLDNLILESINGVKPFLVEKNSISYSDDFWKTLFIEIKQNLHLNNINEKLKNGLSKLSNYEFSPHISVIYKKMTENEQKFVAQNINVKNDFLVSKIVIHEFSNNVEDWKIVKEYDLGG